MSCVKNCERELPELNSRGLRMVFFGSLFKLTVVIQYRLFLLENMASYHLHRPLSCGLLRLPDTFFVDQSINLLSISARPEVVQTCPTSVAYVLGALPISIGLTQKLQFQQDWKSQIRSTCSNSGGARGRDSAFDAITESINMGMKNRT
jgi:hypothetical protein